MTLNPTQLRLARAALGLPNTKRTSYRNRYHSAGEGGFHDQWVGLAATGLAERSTGDNGADSKQFWLTRAGAELALEAGEKLCGEDFPNG